MKEQRRVYEALSKIYSEGKEELSSERIELGAIDDLEKIEAKITNSVISAEKKASAIAKEVIRVADTFGSAARDYDQAKRLFKSIQDASKELGIDVPNKAVSFIRSIEGEINVAEKARNVLDRAARSIQSAAS